MKHELTEHSPKSRELAQRRSGADEVLLVWHPETDRVELSVRDWVTGTGFRVEIAPANAMDAFCHPYAYTSAGATTTVDG